MTQTFGPRYQLAWASIKVRAKLEKQAKKDGTWTEGCDDWFDLSDVEVYQEVEGVPLEAVRKYAKKLAASDDNLYGSVEIRELMPDYYEGIRLAADNSVYIETVDPD